jgi:RimJ/RimL family protein N-acetyltransferase
VDASNDAPVTLQGDRIRLREIAPDDVTAAMRWASDPETFRYMAYEVVPTAEEEAAILAGFVAQAAERPRVQYDLGIEAEAGGLIGMARLGITSFEHRQGDLGYLLRRDEWGKGLVTEAAGLLLELAFTRLGLHRVSAFHDPENAASGRVLQKIGMRREGLFRENVWANGKWRDSVAYAILEPEWSGRPNRGP